MTERRALGIATIVAAGLAFLVHAPTIAHGFLSYDDPGFLRAAVVRDPSLRHVLDTLTKPVWGSFHPLHILSYGLEAKLWGLEHPQGFHATNVVLFAICAGLVVRLARSYGCSVRASALAGVVFAVHPSHVESVAWVAERKDVLMGVFVLLAALARDRTPLAFVLFLCALASKTLAAALAPFLIVDAWLMNDRRFLRFLPFVALAAFWVVIDARGVAAETVKPLRGGSYLEQLHVVFSTLAWYPVRFLWPHPLTPRPTLTVSDARAALVLAAVLAGCARSRRFLRAALFFFLALGPVSNLLPLPGEVQDRYLFLPSIAASLVLGELLARRRALVVAALVAGLFAFEASRYGKCWSDDRALWTEAVRAEPGAPLPRIALAGALLAADDPAGAAEQARRAVQQGGGPLAWSALARIEEASGHRAAARAAFEAAWSAPGADPGSGAALVRFVAQEGDVARARAVLASLEERAPNTGAVHKARAYVAQLENDLRRATREYEAAAAELGADDWLTYAALERTLGDDERARSGVERALILDPSLRPRLAADPALGPFLPR